jgi:hypothetical protein
MAPEIAGGVAGALKGAQMGRAAGVPGMVIGGAVGGIGGAALGKQAQSRLGLQEEETPLESVGEATKEEAIARAITSGLGVAGKVAAPFVKPLTKAGREFLESLDIIAPDAKTEDLFISSSTFDPNATSTRNIIDAQDNILNERLLTTFEETGGRADALRAKKLSDAVLEARRVSDAESAFMRTRDRINDRLVGAIKPNTAIGKIDQVQGEAIKNSFNAKLKSFGPQFKELDKELIPLRRKIRVPLGNAPQAIQNLRPELKQDLPSKTVDNLLDTIAKKLGTKGDVSMVTLTRDRTVTPAQLRALDQEIDNILPNFSENKNVNRS